MKSIATDRGSALIPILLLTGLLGVAGYLLPDLYVTAQKRTVDTERSFKIQNVAFNLKEMGKYLLLYEKVVYMKDPFSLDPQRIQAQRELWPQTYGQWSQGQHHMINSCGGFDALARFVGDLQLGGEPVLCPTYLKNPMLSGKMLEDMVFERWNRGGATMIMKMNGGTPTLISGTMMKVLSGGNGKYTAEIDMTNALYSADQQAFDVVMDSTLRKELQHTLKATAKIVYEFYTDSFGFEMPGNERFVKVSGIVSYNESVGRREQVAQDSFVLYSPTIKDFSIFLPYPTKADGVTPTTSMKESLNLGGSSTEVHGRVFFRGNIDIPLSDLPVFHETVIVTGRFVPAEPRPSDREMIRQKFKKGLITNFESAKYVMDGSCGTIGGNSVNINNQSEISCEAGAGIDEYLEKLGNVCRYSDVKVNGLGVIEYDKTNYPTSRADPMFDINCRPSRFIAGGVEQIIVRGGAVFTASPVKRFVATTATHVYGVVMGGHISVPGGTQFWALPYLHRGLPGISTQTELDFIGAESTSVTGGVTVPLLGIPLIQDSLGSFN